MMRDSQVSVASIMVVEVWKGGRKKVESKFKLGDRFTKKYTRDKIVTNFKE